MSSLVHYPVLPGCSPGWWRLLLQDIRTSTRACHLCSSASTSELRPVRTLGGGASGNYSYSYWYGTLASRPAETSLTLLEPSTCMSGAVFVIQ
eukprot:scaffold331435_cov19-Prasinocladus_malaysianus.AAC.1